MGFSTFKIDRTKFSSKASLGSARNYSIWNSVTKETVKKNIKTEPARMQLLSGPNETTFLVMVCEKELLSCFSLLLANDY